MIFMGSGSGHGVGMSQWAAQAMAEKGIGYRKILRNFYPGTQLAQLTQGTTEGLAEALSQKQTNIKGSAADLPAVSLARESRGIETKPGTTGETMTGNQR